DVTTIKVMPELSLENEVAAMGSPVNKRHRKKGKEEAEANAPPKGAPTLSSRRAGVEISTGNIATTEVRGLFSTGGPESRKSSSVPSIGGLPEDIYQSGWGVTNNCRLDTPEACQDMVDHIVPSGVAEAESDGLHNQTKNLKTLLEAKVDTKKAVEARNAKLAKELESLRVQFVDLQVNNTQLSQQVSNLQAQVTGEEKMKTSFEEFKRYEDDKVEQRCAEMDTRLDKLSVDFDEELYPYMLTAIARGLKHGIEHGRVGRDLADIEAYDLEADSKYVKALRDLKDLKYPLVDQLERLKDAPIDVIMVSLYLESNFGEDAPQWICELRPSSSQLKIPVYTEVCNLKDPWSFKEEILLEDAIAANISRAEKRKKYRVVCRTHGVGSDYHARSDGVPVSVPVAPQGLAILLADAATQTELSKEEASLRLRRSKSLPPMYNLD
nr:transposase (putative), gypsy type [Tanacetum cinerariifolium]